MAHEIEVVNGVASMAYVDEKPWHGLGKQVPADVSPQQMLELAGLDWTVQKVPAFIEVDGQKVDTGVQALVRSTDKSILTTVSDNWNPVQNHEAFEFFHDFVAAGDMEMNTAGSLKNGKMVWALAKVKDSFELFGGDVVESYMLFSNPHQFGKAIDVRFTPIRVVCNNTLTMALEGKAKTQVSVSHRSAFDPDQVKMALGLAKEKLDLYKQQAEFLGRKRYNGESLNEYFTQLFPKTNGADGISRLGEEAMAAVATQPGANFAEGSFWQLFNAVTYVADHVASTTADNRLYSAWYGTMKNKKLDAMNLALQMATAA